MPENPCYLWQNYFMISIGKTLISEDIIEKKLEYMLLFKSWGDQDSAFPVEYFPYLRKLELTPVTVSYTHLTLPTNREV